MTGLIILGVLVALVLIIIIANGIYIVIGKIIIDFIPFIFSLLIPPLFYLDSYLLEHQ